MDVVDEPGLFAHEEAEAALAAMKIIIDNGAGAAFLELPEALQCRYAHVALKEVAAFASWRKVQNFILTTGQLHAAWNRLDNASKRTWAPADPLGMLRGDDHPDRRFHLDWRPLLDNLLRVPEKSEYPVFQEHCTTGALCKKQVLNEFFQFMQCQLRMEARVRMDVDIELEDLGAQRMWADYELYVQTLVGSSWVPFHSVLGGDEMFIAQHILGGVQISSTDASDRQRLMEVFIFWAHRDKVLFTEVQRSHLARKDFWRNPAGNFRSDGQLAQEMLNHTRRTRGAADDEQRVDLMCRHTRSLLDLAERISPIVTDDRTDHVEKSQRICVEVRKTTMVRACGWKLVACIDIVYPWMKLLSHPNCEVRECRSSVQRLLGAWSSGTPSSVARVTYDVNHCPFPSAMHFWSLLGQVEELARDSFPLVPLVLAQMNTPPGAVSTATVRTQLCEWGEWEGGRCHIQRRRAAPQDDLLKEGGSDATHQEEQQTALKQQWLQSQQR